MEFVSLLLYKSYSYLWKLLTDAVYKQFVYSVLSVRWPSSFTVFELCQLMCKIRPNAQKTCAFLTARRDRCLLSPDFGVPFQVPFLFHLRLATFTNGTVQAAFNACYFNLQCVLLYPTQSNSISPLHKAEL